MKNLFLILVFSLSLNSISQQSYIDYVSPYHPVVGNSGMVVSQNYLSSDIGIEILNKGDLTKPMSVPGGFLILKLNDKKEIKVKNNFDVKIETEKAMQYQTNKQLDKFSKVYFSRIKKNSFISE